MGATTRPGLRREEVASLAGVSLDYYKRLERGNLSGVSDGVLEALSGTLQLDDAERAHLFDLARAANPAITRRRRPVPHQVRPDVQRILDTIGTPALVRNSRVDYLTANQLGRALYAPLFESPQQPPNSARFTFPDPIAVEPYPEWEHVADELVAHLDGGCELSLWDEGSSRTAGDACPRVRAYAAAVDHPVNTALGWRLPSWLLTVGPVVLTLIVGVVVIAERHQPPAGLWLAFGVGAAALVWRRRAPEIVLGVVLVVMLALNAASVAVLPTLLVLLTIAEYRGGVWVAAASILAAAAVVAVDPLHGVAEDLAGVLLRLVAIGLPVAVGLYLRARADYIGGLRERGERLERERELLAEQAVAEERVRIARELHDVVAHHVTLMVVQVQALSATGSGDGEQRTGLERVAGLGREALSEMHRMLGVLRLGDGGASDREPRPGVRDLDRLVAETSKSGLEARLAVVGEVRDLPPGVDLSAYRIAQEALTNVVRHAHARHVTVELEYQPDAVLVSVTDDGSGPRQARSASNGDAGGQGLVGMRERVALFDGGLHAGARADAPGYEVRALLPTGG